MIGAELRRPSSPVAASSTSNPATRSWRAITYRLPTSSSTNRMRGLPSDTGRLQGMAVRAWTSASSIAARSADPRRGRFPQDGRGRIEPLAIVRTEHKGRIYHHRNVARHAGLCLEPLEDLEPREVRHDDV